MRVVSKVLTIQLGPRMQHQSRVVGWTDRRLQVYTRPLSLRTGIRATSTQRQRVPKQERKGACLVYFDFIA